MKTQIHAMRWARGLVVGGLFGTAFIAVGCDEFLTASNPGLIQENRLGDSSLVDLMANSAVGALQDVYSWMADYGSMYTDETRNHASFFEEGLYDQRRLQPDNGTLSVFHYSPLMRARWLADSLTSRIRTIEGDSAQRDLRVARSYAIAGFDLVVLAEYFCEVPVPPPGDRYSAPLKPDSIFALAIARFDSAIKIAAASKVANQKVTTGATAAAAQRAVLGADSVRNFALVAKARAALNKGDKALAIATARLVTSMGGATEFEYRVYYNDNTALALVNRFQPDFSGGAGVTVRSVTGTRFIGLDDARVPHPLAANGTPLAEAATGGNWVVPNAGASFSVFNNTKTGADFTNSTSIRVASMLEARYILAEAGGSGGTNLEGQSNIAFVESRRAAFPSTTATTATTAANYVDNLVDQRRRDFFLDGHRMGDLRRYKNKNGLDLWEKGAMYGTATTFNDQTCWPMNVAEITNNPLVPKPYIPPQQ